MAKVKATAPVRHSLRFEGERSLDVVMARMKLYEARERYLNAKAVKATGRVAHTAYLKVMKQLEGKRVGSFDCSVMKIIAVACANSYKLGSMDV